MTFSFSSCFMCAWKVYFYVMVTFFFYLTMNCALFHRAFAHTHLTNHYKIAPYLTEHAYGSIYNK